MKLFYLYLFLLSNSFSFGAIFECDMNNIGLGGSVTGPDFYYFKSSLINDRPFYSVSKNRDFEEGRSKQTVECFSRDETAFHIATFNATCSFSRYQNCHFSFNINSEGLFEPGIFLLEILPKRGGYADYPYLLDCRKLDEV